MSVNPIKLWRDQKKNRKILGQIGTILAWTQIFVPLVKFSSNTPYFSALIQFDSGEKTFGQIVDCSLDEIKDAKKVKAVLRKLYEPNKESIIPYGVKFVLVK